MTARRLAAACAAIALLRAAPAAAQFRIDLEPGAQVRFATIAAPDVHLRGRVARVDGNGSTVIVWPRGTPAGTETRHAVADLASLEVRAGKDRLRGALVGATIGTLLATVFGGIDQARGNISSDELASTVVGNAAVGGVLGLVFAPRGWRRLPLPGRP